MHRSLSSLSVSLSHAPCRQSANGPTAAFTEEAIYPHIHATLLYPRHIEAAHTHTLTARLPLAHTHPGGVCFPRSFLLRSVASAGLRCVCFAGDRLALAEARLLISCSPTSRQSGPRLLRGALLYTSSHLFKMSLEADNKMS